MKTAFTLIVIGFIFNFLETWYFGWNLKASCPAEMICDYIASALMVAGSIWSSYLFYEVLK